MIVRRVGNIGMFYLLEKELGCYKYLYYHKYQKRVTETPNLDLLIEHIKREV